MHFANVPRICVLAIVLLASGSAAGETVATKDTSASTVGAEQVERIDSALRDLVSKSHTAGLKFGIQIGDKPPLVRTYGFADLSSRRPVRASDEFRIASITKPLTATAVLKLERLKKLSLDDRLEKFFPDYPNGALISIRQLLSHTSGIPNWWDGELPSDTPKEFPMCDEPHKYLQRMKTSSIFSPGEFFKYSNTGYVLLGEIIEKVSGRSYESFLQEHVIAPAGMVDTRMEYIDQPLAAYGKGYTASEFGEPEIYHVPFAAGGLRSTAADLLSFVSSLRAGKIVPKAVVAEMTSYARVNDGRFTFEAPFVPPGSDPPKVQEHIAKRGYGLGFNLMEAHGTPVYFHSGGIAGFNAYLLHVPKNATTVVLLANTEDGLLPALKQVLKLATEIR